MQGWIFTLHSFLFLSLVTAVTYNVGPTRTYTTIQSVVNLLRPGDIVLVDYANYTGTVRFNNPGTLANPITITGIKNAQGLRPLIRGGTNTVQFELSHYMIFQSFEVTGGTSRCIYHHANEITLRDIVMHDCLNQGLLGADQDSGNCTLEYSEVYRCGNGTYGHQIYMSSNPINFPNSRFRMQFNYVHDAIGGNNVKSRAQRNEIYYNWIEGAMYHELELVGPDPSGGVPENYTRYDSDVVGNVLFKRNTFYVNRFGGDGTGQSWGRYRFVDNTVITQPNGSAIFRLFDGIQSLEVHNSIFYSSASGMKIIETQNAKWANGTQSYGTNNWYNSNYMNNPPYSSVIGWVQNITGTNPGFVNLSANNLQLTSNSPCVGSADPGPLVGPPGFPFPNGLFPPEYLPPMRALIPVGTATPRKEDPTKPDVGAYVQAQLYPEGYFKLFN